MNQMDFLNPIESGTFANPYKEFTITIPVSGRVPIFYAAQYFRVMSLTGTGLRAVFGGTGAETDIIGAGIGIRLPVPVDQVTLINGGASPITVTVAMSMGIVNDDRLNVTGVISIQNTSTTPIYVRNDNNVVQSSNAVSVGTAAVAIGTSNANTTAYSIFNASTQTVYLGTSSVTVALGFPLLPNQSYHYDGNVNLWGIVASGTADVRFIRYGVA